MSMVYLEDILEVVDNKYLAVNMAAQRARQLNEREFALLSSTTRKPASVATEELIKGKIGCRNADPAAEESDELLIFSADPDEAVEDSEDMAELVQTEIYAEETEAVVDPEEREEGL
ncbi:MAG: DNA-directed RNA polymerase subunit omega [Candidatus Poribacteria bacterium]|nr:DNA-directed RNA polymerase subunit omega [Candidatus Poribacteria bacterium]